MENGFGDDIVYGSIRFSVPNDTVTAEERALFAAPGSKELSQERLPLHNFRTSPDIVKGPAGLDVQGFTYVNHRSVLSNSDQFLSGRNIEETYFAEVEALIRDVTGARTAIVSNTALRSKIVTDQNDPSFMYMRDCEVDKMIQKMPRDVPIVVGKKQDESLEPLRLAHIDYTNKGLRAVARYNRTDIKALAQDALDAEDAKATDVPRYAAYSVWRPLKPVKRDPLAVCDWRTLDRARDLRSWDYRALSGVNESGEFTIEAWNVLPPAERPTRQKWYWMPQQQPDEVLVIKLSDTAADVDPTVAQAAAHASPVLDDVDGVEARNSIECRVLAFW